MPKRISQNELNVILDAVAPFPDGIGIEELLGTHITGVPRRTLQRRLALLVERNLLVLEGRGRASRYRLPVVTGQGPIVQSDLQTSTQSEDYIPLSPEGDIIKQAIRQAVQNRHPVGYNRTFLDSYQPL